MKWIVLFLFAIGSVYRADGGVRAVIQQTAHELMRDSTVAYKVVGYEARRSQQWDRFQKLNAEATEDELVQLAAHRAAAVRCYSFLALATRKSRQTFPILLKLLADSAKVTSISGCTVFKWTVGDACLDYVTTGIFCEQRGMLKLTKQQQQTVDSVLLYAPGIYIGKKDWIVRNTPPAPHVYDRLREIAVGEGNLRAVVVVAKYRKAQDKELVIELLKNPDRKTQMFGLEAVLFFPDPDFFPWLQAIHEAEVKKQGRVEYAHLIALYKAIVKYKTPEAKALISNGYAVESDWGRDYHIRSILKAQEE